MKKTILILIIASTLTGCSNAVRSSFKSWGAKHKIVLYGSSGIEIRSWESTGQIEVHDGGMCFFQDDATGNPVYIYGTFTVEIGK